MKFVKRSNGVIGFIIINIIVFLVGYSNKNDSIQVKNYFPIDKPITYELEGTFNDMQNDEIEKMTVQFVREGKSKVAGKDVYVEKQIYFDELKNKNAECEIYSNYDKDGNIIEFGKKVNDKLTWHSSPGVFLQNGNIGDIHGGTDKTVLASNEGDNGGNKGTIELKGLVDLKIDDKIYKDCLFVEKNFYNGKDISRKEQSYLKKDFGLIKYVEESFDSEPYKFEISYKEK